MILPLIVFAIGCLLAFATGTSWGTFGILIPIVQNVFSINTGRARTHQDARDQVGHPGHHRAGDSVWFSMAGRLSAPLFLFCLVEGFTHTSNKKRYFIKVYAIHLLMSGWLASALLFHMGRRV